MKRFASPLLALFPLLLALFPASVCAEPSLPDGLSVSDGRVTGEFTTVEGGIYLVDMPVPVAPEPAEKLTVEYRQFTEDEVRAALIAAGQSGEGTIRLRGEFIEDSVFFFNGDYDAESSADVSLEEAKAQAVAIALAFVEALDIDCLRESPSVRRVYEYDDSNLQFWHTLSEAEAYSEYLRASYYSPKRLRSLPEQQSYTDVSFEILLDGRFMDGHTGYPVDDPYDPATIETVTTFVSVWVSDCGEIVRAEAQHIPQAFTREPAEPLMDWREYLSYYQQNPIAPEDQQDRTYFRSEIGMEIIEYAALTVLIGLEPIYQCVSQNEWVPVWGTTTITYVPHDGWRSEPRLDYWPPLCLNPRWP